MTAALALGSETRFRMPSDELASSPALARWEPVERAGEGASSVVWKVKGREAHAALVGALKVARGPAASEALRREAMLLARIGRRWGPSLLDAGPGFLVTSWTEGKPVDRAAEGLSAKKREALVAQVAHAVGRALDELHQASVHHGDVKPGNVLLAVTSAGRGGTARDASGDRAATLIDLGLGGDIGAPALGGTPRYAAPELRAHGEAGPAADLWALGILLAELLDPDVSAAADPREAIAAWSREAKAREGEPARWIEALVAASPGGRPGAAWVGARAARWLGLSRDEAEERLSRVDRVRRTYLFAHAADVAALAPVAPVLTGAAHDWLEEALGWVRKLGAAPPAGVASGNTAPPLGALRTARWLVSLVGPAAASWPMRDDPRSESELVSRAVELARVCDPSASTLEELLGDRVAAGAGAGWDAGDAGARLVRMVGELSRSTPAAAAIDLAENDLASGRGPSALAIPLARALTRAGETGRAWATLAGVAGADADALRSEVARRRGETALASSNAERALSSPDPGIHASAAATLARVAWDRGDLTEAEARLRGLAGPAIVEVRALLAWRRGTYEPALDQVRRALSGPLESDVRARLEAAAGLLELARGSSATALASFGRAVEHATRAGAVVDEATYLTSEAAAATDVGDESRALASATRAAVLWERLGRPAQAARAWLARAGALATIGAAHGADEAAAEASSRALSSRDTRAAAFARWAQVEVRPAGDERARAWAVQADEALREEPEDRARSGARLLVWAPSAIDDARIASTDELVRAMPAPTRWEWWGARAAAMLAGRKTSGDGAVLGALVALAAVPAPLSSRGPALDAAVRLATELGDGESARRLEVARQAAAQVLREGAPPEYLASLAAVAWARSAAIDPGDVAFAPAQVAQLEAIVRSLSGRDRLRPLLEQVLDTLVLWTGVERGLLLLRAPDGKLVPRAARNLARKDLVGEQLVLSQTIARRAIEEGTAICRDRRLLDAGRQPSARERPRASGCAACSPVPLVARGETLGVVYSSTIAACKGAFRAARARVGPGRRLASRHGQRRRRALTLRAAAARGGQGGACPGAGRVAALLAERDAELSATRTQLELTRDARETRFAVRRDRRACLSEPMRSCFAWSIA